MIIDLRFVDIEYELWSLREFLKNIEDNLSYTQEVRVNKTKEYLQQEGYNINDAEVDIAYQEMYEITELIIPKSFRYAFIIMLWACYESGIKKIVNIRGDGFNKKKCGFIKKSEEYFENNLKLSLDGEWYDKEKIHFLYELRNALVHGNGSKAHVKPTIWKKLQRNLNTIDLQSDSILVTNELLHTLYKMVNHTLVELIKITKNNEAILKEEKDSI